jgi:hypothetical protein
LHVMVGGDDGVVRPKRNGWDWSAQSQTTGLTLLDAKTGLLTGLLTGIQGWKCPVALSQTCYGSKSLKVILMDSNFGGHPVLNPLVTL